LIDPEEETDFEEVKFKADVAINHRKLIVAGIKKIPKGKVVALIRNGKEVESKHIRDMLYLKKAGGNGIKYRIERPRISKSKDREGGRVGKETRQGR
jgi:hypothetical protein